MISKIVGQKEGKNSSGRVIFVRGKINETEYLGGNLLDAWIITIQVSESSDDLKIINDQEAKFWYLGLNKNEIFS